jgi:hypothetical protein
MLIFNKGEKPVKKFMLLPAFMMALLFAVGCDVQQEEEGELPDVDVDADVEEGQLPEYEIEQTQEGEMPDVDVDVDSDPGKLPEYDVEVPDVDVGMEEKEVTVPDIDVETEEKTITVPDVDVDMPGDDEEPGQN